MGGGGLDGGGGKQAGQGSAADPQLSQFTVTLTDTDCLPENK